MSTGSARTRTLAALTTLALAGTGTVALSTSASAAPGGALVYGLTTDDRLVSFRVDTLTVDNGQEIGGLRLDEDVVGIDVRPSTGQVIGVVNGALQDRLVTIDPATGAATTLDTLDVDLSGTSFGVDVDPQVDALRIVSNNGQNLRHPFATGTTVADTALTHGSGTAPQVTGAAYTNNVAGTGSTELFDIDSARDVLALQSPPAAGTLVTRGALGVDVLQSNGFDVEAGTGTAYASLQTTSGVALYTVDLATGAATRKGALPNTVEDITLATPRFAVTAATVTEGGAAQVVVRRFGDTADAVTVDYATSSGSATEGSDFTRTTGTVSFAAGETSKTVSVPTTFTGGVEGAESFTVTLSNPTSGTVLSPAGGTVTITDAEDGRAYALLTNNALRTVAVNDPSDADGGTPVLGLQLNDDLVGIDVRPANGVLYGVAASGRIYTINPQTGAATEVSRLSAALAGTAFGVDFNPALDRLRIVSNNGQNLSVNVETGDTTPGSPLRYAAGDPNDQVTPAVAGAGYTNNVAGGTPTVLLDIDTATDSLVRQSPPNDGVLTTVGPLGVTLAATATVGLDISNVGGNAFAVLLPQGITSPSLYRIDTTNGAARLLGAFSTTGGTVEDIALVPATQASASPAPTATGTASPTPTATASGTPSPTATATPSQDQFGRVAIALNRSVIFPGNPVTVTVTGTPGSPVELQAYSRPSTEYRQVRRGLIGETGSISFDVTPGTNTRLFARVIGFPNTESESQVINVRTALSLTVVRNGTRDYTFQGRILPRRAGQLITLYRVDNGRRIITTQIKTDSTGTYRINRKFTGSGTFGFLTRTGQTLTNAAGESNTRPQNTTSGQGTVRPTAIF